MKRAYAVLAVTVVVLVHAGMGRAATCGDYTVEGPEACDPPGMQGTCGAGFLCDETCAGCVDQSLCGNTSPDPFETCDPPYGPAGCPGGMVCNASCTGCQAPACGNALIEGAEVCDPPFSENGCPSNSKCNDTCSGCVDQGTCGNSTPDPFEVCDPPATSGVCGPGLVCNGTCTSCVEPSCGNAVVEEPEACDPPLESGGCPVGSLCNLTCGGCVDQSLCGNGTLDPGEPCDPPGSSAGCPFGRVCDGTCTGCIVPPCGDGLIQGEEACDPPFAEGVCGAGFLCAGGCGGCVETSLCGNGTPDPFEACDPPNEQGGCPEGQRCSECLLCMSITPRDAKQMKGEFVRALTPCTSPNAVTSNGFPACAPAAEIDPGCTFTTRGKGKYSAATNPSGPDRVPGTSDDGDLTVQASLIGLDAACSGTTLTMALSIRRTLTDCGGLLCTVSDVTDLPVGSCTVDSVGKCNIKTTVNSTSPGALSGGKRTSVEIFGVAMMNGALKVLSGGVLLH